MAEPLNDSNSIDYNLFMKQEYAKCASDPLYFITRYVKIQGDKGKMLFALYLFQIKLLALFIKHKRISVVKSRQLGITTLCAAYSFWFIFFHPDKTVLCLAPDRAKSKIIVDKVKYAYQNLPPWMRRMEKAVVKNALSFSLSNGSKITSESGKAEAARSLTAHLLIVDEAAFIANAEDKWGSAAQTLNTTNGSAIVLSTPNGIGNWFHKNHMETEFTEYDDQMNVVNPKDFVGVKLPWQVMPGRDQAWRDAETKAHGERMAKQECDADFESSGNTVIHSDILKAMIDDNWIKDPVEVSEFDHGLWIWKYPEPGKSYVIVADVSRGDGQDYSTAQIIDIEDNEQVGEYRGLVDTKVFPGLLVSWAYRYNQALLIIEREAMGWGVVKDVIETGYPNIYYSPKEGMVMDSNTWSRRNYDNDITKMTPGFSTNVKFRPLVIGAMQSLLDNKLFIIHSKRTHNELQTFIWSPTSKAMAAKGYNDDLVIPIGIYSFLRDTALKYRESGREMTKVLLNNVSKGSLTKEAIDKAREMDYKSKWNETMRLKWGGRDEDISWLL